MSERSRVCKSVCYLTPIHSFPINFATDGKCMGYYGNRDRTDLSQSFHPSIPALNKSSLHFKASTEINLCQGYAIFAAMLE